MYVKLFTHILDSSIADNRKLRHFFTDLLLCADPKGFVMMTKGAIARRIGCSLEEVEWGIAELEKPDRGSRTPDREGCRIVPIEGSGYGWEITNYETYRAMKDADQLREATKERVRRFRERRRQGDVTPGNANGNGSNANTESEAEGEPEAKAQPPPTPQGGSGEGGMEKPDKRLPTTEIPIRIANLFNRKLTTPWSDSEFNAFKKVRKQVTAEDMTMIEAYYAAERAKGKDGIHRRDLKVFVNNLLGEIDRARAWNTKQGPDQNPQHFKKW